MAIIVPQVPLAVSPWRPLLVDGGGACKAACKYCPDPTVQGRPLAEADLGEWAVGTRGVQGINIIARPYPEVAADLYCLVQKLVVNNPALVIVTLGPGAPIDTWGLQHLKEAGATGVCFSLVAVTRSLDASTRPGRGGRQWWDTCWELVDTAISLWGPGKVGLTLGLGLGETEQQVMATIQQVRDRGAVSYIYPLMTTAEIKVSTGKLYRVLLARHLITTGQATSNQMQYDDFGQVIHFGVPRDRFYEIMQEAKPFSLDNLWLDCCSMGWQAELAAGLFPAQPGAEMVPELIRRVCSVDWREAWLTRTRVFELEGVDFDEDEIEAENGSIYKMIAELGRAGRSN
ncbi:MAG: lipoyl synthase [Clostridia bacterium]|nr:lipoyl synthase [Clostridia bacterium]